MSALVFLPVFLVRFIRVSGRSLIVSLIGIVGIYGVISLFLLEQAASFSDQFARYVGDELYGRSGNFDISNFMYCSVPIVGYYILRDQTEAMDKSDMTRILAMLLYVGIIVTILSGGVFIFSRFAYYFTSFAILLVPNLLSETQKASRRDMFAASYVVILSVSCAYFYGYLNFNMVDPYRWCF